MTEIPPVFVIKALIDRNGGIALLSAAVETCGRPGGMELRSLRNEPFEG
jgi:hypothetical protein